MTNPNDPAYPQTIPIMGASAQFKGALEKVGDQFVPGLTKREYFAGLALSVICWHSALRDGRVTPEIIANEAVVIADALIAELNKKEDKR